MRVDADVAPAAASERVAGEMKFLHRGGRNAVQVAVSVKTMVHGVDVQVVDVQQNGAAGLPYERGQELPLGYFVALEPEITRDVLDQNLAAEGVLNVADPRRGMAQCFLGVRERQEVVQVPAADRAPREVFGYQHGLELPHQALDLA